jgi:diaminopimelate decarboxylase
MESPASHAELTELSPGLRPGSDGRLAFGGCALADLATEFGTAAILVDVATLRSTAERYVDATAAIRPNSRVHFATKAFPVPAIVRIMAEAGLHCDVASAGELAIALAGDMPPERVLLHGNAKGDHDIEAALKAGVGLIVIDSFDDMDRIERLAGQPQPVIVRINPGVLAPTHEAMATGHGESKFGIPAGQVEAAIERATASPKMEMLGLHVHIGSQILELDPFVESVERIAALGKFDLYDLGGGLGSRYVMDEPAAPSIEDYAEALFDAAALHLPEESVVAIEPGRSTVAPAGVTLYSVVGVKRGERTFVAIDGGMGDNMETALYGTRFWPAIVDKDGEPERCDVVGHHCESGDRLATDAWLSSPEVGDLLVIPVTGAYCHSMANNYNAMPRPPVILVEDGDARVAIRRETIADLLARAT